MELRKKNLPCLGLLFLACTVAEKQKKIVPSLKHSLTTPVVRAEGDDALLTCVVNQQRNYTLMWKKEEKSKAGSRILTANDERVTSDARISVLHEDGGEVYVLLIKNTTAKDVGMYVCEINSDPPIRSFHQLKLISGELRPPESSLVSPTGSEAVEAGEGRGEDALTVWGFSTSRPIEHDYTDCCLRKNVSSACHGFCNLKSILEGVAGPNPAQCEADFPSIASCMADGRNHMPCCLEAGIPPVCTDLCRGEYTVQTDFLKTHFSCAAYTAPTLACISAGIDLLPGPPQEMGVSALNDTAIRISWRPPHTNPNLNKQYVVNITYHQLLSPVYSVTVDSEVAKQFYPPFSKIHRVPINRTSVVLNNLERFSLYEVTMWTEGINSGRSLPTYKEMVVTHVEGESAMKPAVKAPELPDIKSCCMAKNVSHSVCVDKFCDPVGVREVSVSDMMICAPWDSQMFSCLSDGRDHSPCCSTKQIPPICQELCSGKVTDINFKYFRCLSYMKEMSSCLLEGYGVLPSSPLNFRFSNVDTSFVILHWETPSKLGETVVDYTVTYQEIGASIGVKRSIPHASSPFILEHLNSSTAYEVYVEAVNEYGAGEESARIVLRTVSRTVEDLQTVEHPYNETECCLNSGILPQCQPLCSYNAKMSDVERLGLECVDEFSKMVRCAVGGRDHLPCCARRGVPKACQPLCQAVHQKSTGADFTKCLPYIGQIFSCLEEGTAVLPPPIRNLRAVQVTDTNVVLDWKIDEDDAQFNTTHFEVYYKRIDENSTEGTVFSSDNQINTTEHRAEVGGLTTGVFYRFFVVSRNEVGTSLPSSLIKLNVSSEAWTGEAVLAAAAPPHLLEVEAHSATWLQFTWNPPAITHPEDVLRYRLFYRQVSGNSTDFDSIETDITTVKIVNLTPNTQYILYAEAISRSSGGGTGNRTAVSEPSETLIAWTDPAFPAFVEAPTIHPINRVTEGSNMTVLCIAMGTPEPTVTLYVNNQPIRSLVSRHMVTVIENVSKEMGHVSCYADNGYGTPMQASRQITISRKPTVSAVDLNSGMIGDEMLITCTVDAFPAPTIAVFRDRELKVSVQSDERINITASGSADDPANFVLSLRIKSLAAEDSGVYYCHANNTEGEGVASTTVTVSEIPAPVIDVTDCCRKQNVTNDCLDICSFSIDFDTMQRKPHCLPQFDKLMHCASDGSDHRHCCNNLGVPDQCINWCRGKPASDNQVCALTHSKAIISCFHEGNRQLPSPPRNIVVRLGAEKSANVFWDVPEKNPDQVELYRVYWRPVGNKETLSNDTTDTKMTLKNLDGGTTYELVVKAGNSHGTSHLTAPLRFATGDEVIIETSARASSGASQVIGIIIAVLAVAMILLGVLYFMKKKNIVLSVKKPNSPTVAFENPFYSSRDNQINNQVINLSSEVISSSSSWQGEMSVRNTSDPEETEPRDSSVFPGIKFGKVGQGFQRFQ